MLHRFIKKVFFRAITYVLQCITICYNVLNVNSLECVSMYNQECKIRTEIINLNTNDSLFHLFSIEKNRRKGSCNTFNDPCAKIYVPDQIKNTNVKVFNLMSRPNETRHIKWYK